MKTPKKVSIKVQRIFETLFRMSIWNANTIYSRMTIIFFSDGENAIFKLIFPEKIIFAFLTEG